MRDDRAQALLVLRAQTGGLLDRVSPASWAVLALHYLQEMTLQEVADILELSLGTAKSRLAYGLASLRRLLPKG